MKNKVVKILTIAVLALSSTSQTYAFWPFDGWKSKGEVKAAVSEEVGRKYAQTDANLKKAHALFVILSDMDAACKNLNMPLFTGIQTRQWSPSPEVTDRVMGSMDLVGSLNNPGEITSIISVLKTRCENNSKLLERLKKVYTGSSYVSELSTATPQTPSEAPIIKRPELGTESGKNYRPGAIQIEDGYGSNWRNESKPSLLDRLRNSRKN